MPVDPSDRKPVSVDDRTANTSHTPQLGLGTASFGSRIGRSKAIQLLGTALDLGIAHIDTAPSYGAGEAEYVIGVFLRGRREQVTLATKVGILRPRRSPALSVAKGIARTLLSVAPGLRSRLRRHAQDLVQAGHFDPITMKASFESSLRALRTEYVDLLLLHDCSAAEVVRPETQDFLLEMKRQGKARQVGVASSAAVAQLAWQRAPAICNALQLPAEDACTLTQPTPTLYVHSIFRPLLQQLDQRVRVDDPFATRWQQRLQVDLHNRNALARLALQARSHQLPHATLLVASTRPDHLRANAMAIREELSAEQFANFNDMVLELTRPLD